MLSDKKTRCGCVKFCLSSACFWYKCTFFVFCWFSANNFLLENLLYYLGQNWFFFSQQLVELHRFQWETLSVCAFLSPLVMCIAFKTSDGNSKTWTNLTTMAKRFWRPYEVVSILRYTIKVSWKHFLCIYTLADVTSGPMTSSLTSENVTVWYLGAGDWWVWFWGFFASHQSTLENKKCLTIIVIVLWQFFFFFRNIAVIL